MSEVVISVSGVGKCYSVFENQRSRFFHALHPYFKKSMEEIWALQDINFEIKRGEAVAIIGRNGGGKSTLLAILTGTLTPTTGSVKVNGRVCALLELGSGFNPEYSGRDNVILNGLLLGLSKKEITSRFSEIEAFAEIGEAIERPVRTYSSGMIMRLAFAVQILCNPDILIIDEALSVGDFFFQQKCFSYIRELCSKGVTLLFVSHDIGAVRDLCTRAVHLRQGSLVMSGEVNTVIQSYLTDVPAIAITGPCQVNEMKCAPHTEMPWRSTALWQQSAIGSSTQLLAVEVDDGGGKETLITRIGETLRFIVWYRACEVEPVHVSVVLKNRYGQVVNCTSSYSLGLKMPSYLEPNVAPFTLALKMQLEAGQYSLQVSLGTVGSNMHQARALGETPWLGPLTLSWDYSISAPPFYGMFGLPVDKFSPSILQDK